VSRRRKEVSPTAAVEAAIFTHRLQARRKSRHPVFGAEF
jgi:hypothetical protein